MKRPGYTSLVFRALWELVRYEVVQSLFGFNRIHDQMAKFPVRRRAVAPGMETAVCDAVTLAMCFYYKRVLCLQRSTVAARILRRKGIDARLVIGVRPAPFLSHAWVEVDGRTVNDSPVYRERLQILSVV
ncbi:MAG TPA: lasso peptide biosynthesis B2 protein [Bryobacteraceae bacterium]|nr:lasso peptide biosynthesis B2 protein [Bryobacteraceae bacterium]